MCGSREEAGICSFVCFHKLCRLSWPKWRMRCNTGAFVRGLERLLKSCIEASRTAIPDSLKLSGLLSWNSCDTWVQSCLLLRKRVGLTWFPPHLGFEQNYYQHRILFYFWPHNVACGILVPWPGIEPEPLGLKVWSPNHWTTGELLRAEY